MNFPHRYERNSIISEEAQRMLGGKKDAVTGLGGLGGFAIEELVHFGTGHTGEGCTLRHKLLTVDLYNNEFERVLL